MVSGRERSAPAPPGEESGRIFPCFFGGGLKQWTIEHLLKRFSHGTNRKDAMPFVAECILCKHRVRVPDHALGASGRCPRCASYFTLAPADDIREPGSEEPAADPAPAASR